MSQLRVLVADDNQTMRAAYKEILETNAEISVVGLATDGQEALDQAVELKPDVVLLDVRMPNMDGLAAANRIMALESDAAIVLVSAYDDLAFVRAIMHSGASKKAYILKNSLDDIPEFHRVVMAVANGQAVLHGTIIQNLLDIYHRMPASQVEPFTDAEERVLGRMLQGYNETEIAQILRWPNDQIEGLVTSICDKLGIVQEEGLSRSPQVVEAIVTLCVA